MKNTWFNRVFHGKTLRKQERQLKDQLKFGESLLIKLSKATKLQQVFEIHKEAWSKGFRNENLGPCPYGMFRTDDIATMSPSEVFLGNIGGLWTFPLPEWEESDSESYKKVLEQYKHILRSNINALIIKAKNYYER